MVNWSSLLSMPPPKAGPPSLRKLGLAAPAPACAPLFVRVEAVTEIVLEELSMAPPSAMPAPAPPTDWLPLKVLPVMVTTESLMCNPPPSENPPSKPPGVMAPPSDRLPLTELPVMVRVAGSENVVNGNARHIDRTAGSHAAIDAA